jgi:hypothetical protein
VARPRRARTEVSIADLDLIGGREDGKSAMASPVYIRIRALGLGSFGGGDHVV